MTSKTNDIIICESIVKCERKGGVNEFLVNILLKSSGERKEAWLPGFFLPEIPLTRYLQELKKTDPTHPVFQADGDKGEDRADKVKLLRAIADAPEKQVIGELFEGPNSSQLKPRMQKSVVDEELAQLSSDSCPERMRQLLVNVIDDREGIRSGYEPMEDEERWNLAAEINLFSNDQKMILFSKNIRNVHAKSLRSLRYNYTDTFVIPSALDDKISKLLKQNKSCTCTTDECELRKCHYKAYDKEGRLIKCMNGRVIYECNSNCKCKKSCPNRVVQNGSIVQKEVFLSLIHI